MQSNIEKYFISEFSKVASTIKGTPLYPEPLVSQYSLVCPTNKRVLLHNRSMTVKIQEINTDTLYNLILRPQSSFFSCPNDALFYSRMLI